MPQRSWTIGPKTWRPAVGGNTRRRSLSNCGALRSGSTGKRIELSVPVLRPSRRVEVETVRCRPSRPPMPVRVKPRPRGIGREALDGDQDQEGVALAAVGQARSEQPDGFDGDAVGQFQLEHAAVFGPLGIEAQIPAAGYARRGNRQPQPRRRFEAEGEIGHPEVAAGFGKAKERSDADALDLNGHGADGETRIKRSMRSNPVVFRGDTNPECTQCEWPDGCGERPIRVESRMPTEMNAGLAGPADGEIKLRGKPLSRQHACQETVSVRAGEGHTRLLDD